jgi:hypothetical protein
VGVHHRAGAAAPVCVRDARFTLDGRVVRRERKASGLLVGQGSGSRPSLCPARVLQPLDHPRRVAVRRVQLEGLPVVRDRGLFLTVRHAGLRQAVVDVRRGGVLLDVEQVAVEQPLEAATVTELRDG